MQQTSAIKILFEWKNVNNWQSDKLITSVLFAADGGRKFGKIQKNKNLKSKKINYVDTAATDDSDIGINIIEQ